MMTGGCWEVVQKPDNGGAFGPGYVTTFGYFENGRSECFLDLLVGAHR